MTRPIRPALALLALPLVGAIAGPHFFGGDFDHLTTIASETPNSPRATAAPVPDSLAPGFTPAEVESGTRNSNTTWTSGPDYNETARSVAADDPIIGDPAHSDVQYATVGETADRLARVAVGLPPAPGRP